MRTRKGCLIKNFCAALLAISCCLLPTSNVFADSYTVYNPSYSVSYAKKNYNTPYGSKSSQNPFGDYSYLVNGGNCANFVSQAIMAGMANSDSMATVFGQRTNFDVDASKGTAYQWYYINDSKRGSAFTGANKLCEYAAYNSSDYKGLHFEHVTYDTLTKYMDYDKVKEGDVIFADWDHDGTVDHSMLVTEKKWRLTGYLLGYRGYNRIRVTYQGCPGVVGKTDVGLGDINDDPMYVKNKYHQALFYVFRPVNYNPNGK